LIEHGDRIESIYYASVFAYPPKLNIPIQEVKGTNDPLSRNYIQPQRRRRKDLWQIL